MKNPSLLLLILTILLQFSCKKEEDQTFSNHDFIGGWTWTHSYCGDAGEETNPENTGQEIKLLIDGTLFREFTNGVLTFSSEYVLTDKGFIATINFFNGTKQSIQLYGETLILSDQCTHCCSDYYER